MCMYFTKGIKKNGYMLCKHCNMKKHEHPIFMYIDNMTSQCDDIILLIQEYIKNDIQSIAGGYQHTVRLMQDNTVKCWGNNYVEQCDVPDSIQGKVHTIECGRFYSIAVLNDGSVICWGDNEYGQCNVPEGLKIMRKN